MQLSAYIGVPSDQEIFISPVIQEPTGYTIATVFVPFLLEGRVSGIPILDTWTKTVIVEFLDPSSLLSRAIYWLGDAWDYNYFNTRRFHAGEAPSYGGFANARSMAKLASMMVNKGSWEGKKILSTQGYEKASECVIPTYDHALGMTSSACLGGFARTIDALPDVDDDWYGWAGLGGSLVMWNPKLKTGFAYTMTALGHYGAVDIRAENLLDSTDEVVRFLKHL